MICTDLLRNARCMSLHCYTATRSRWSASSRTTSAHAAADNPPAHCLLGGGGASHEQSNVPWGSRTALRHSQQHVRFSPDIRPHSRHCDRQQRAKSSHCRCDENATPRLKPGPGKAYRSAKRKLPLNWSRQAAAQLAERSRQSPRPSSSDWAAASAASRRRRRDGSPSRLDR